LLAVQSPTKTLCKRDSSSYHVAHIARPWRARQGFAQIIIRLKGFI